MKKGLSVAVYATDFGPIVYSGANTAEWDVMFAKVKKAGYDGVDLFTDVKSAEEFRTIKGLLDAHGLEVGMMISICLKDQGVNFSSADESVRRRSVETYCREIEKAAIFAPCNMPIGYIRGPLADGERLEDNLARLAESVRALTAFAKCHGIHLCIEPINRYEADTLLNVPDTVRFIQRHGLQDAFILADLFHMNIEDADMAAALRQAGPLLGHMHVPDSNRAAPGMGHIDYHPILEALRDIGYDGYLSSEAMPFGDSDGCAARGAETLDRLLG